MTAITGDVTTYLDLLGLAPDAPQVAAVVDAFGVEVERDEIDLGDERRDSVILADAGVELTFAADQLTAIFLSLRGSDGHAPFASRETLVDGLTFDEDRAGIRAVLGSPVDEGAQVDVFAVGQRSLHVEYEDDRPQMVTALLQQVQG